MLQIRNVSKNLGQRAVLSKVNLDVDSGEFVTLLGPSGCGKTTLLRLIAGLDAPDEGSIWIDGRDVTAQPANLRPIHTVFQRFALFPHMNVFENVSYSLRIKNTPAEEIHRRVLEVLELVGLQDRAESGIQSLSGGEQQRVALARSVINRPRLLLLDEPFSALDAKLKLHLQDELVQIQRKLKMTFVFVTHDQGEALAMSDRLVVIKSGQLQQAGPPSDVYNSPVNPWVADFVGRMNWIPGAEAAGFRPEKTEILNSAPEGPTTFLKAVIKSKSFHGTHLQFVVELSDRSTWQIFKPNFNPSLFTSPEKDWGPGTSVFVGGENRNIVRCRNFEHVENVHQTTLSV